MSQNIAFTIDEAVILVGGGEVNHEHLRQLASHGYPIIAADGAANYVHQTLGRVDAIIGDMDSLSPLHPPSKGADMPFEAIIKQWQEVSILHHLEEQETTDFEKCLYSVSAPLYYCFGFLGGRFDHSFSSIHVAYKYAASHQILIYSQNEQIEIITKDILFRAMKEDIISILPLTPCDFTTSHGLKYPLDGLSLKMGEHIGSSNAASDEYISIHLNPHKKSAYILTRPIERIEAYTNSQEN